MAIKVDKKTAEQLLEAEAIAEESGDALSEDWVESIKNSLSYAKKIAERI
jgi:hypothetical protein